MALELKFNDKYETLDLIGRLPAGTKSRVAKIMTYNSHLQCYQGAVSMEVVKIAFDLNANIPPELVDALKDLIDVFQRDTEKGRASTARPGQEKRE